MTTQPLPALNIKIEFSGGLELLFGNQRSHLVQIPSTTDTSSTNITYLIDYLKKNLLKEREELFTEGKSVWVYFDLCYLVVIIDICLDFGNCRRPGILVLINDTDWELEGEGDYVLKDRDEIVFISTLHGG